MKTQMIRTVLALSTVSLFGGLLHAQSYELRANVPFTFHVSNQVFEAGNYRLWQSADGMTNLRTVATGHGIFISGAYRSLDKNNPGKLVFTCYSGHQCFLSEIRPFNGNGSLVPKSKTEKNLISDDRPHEVATISIDLRRAD